MVEVLPERVGAVVGHARQRPRLVRAVAALPPREARAEVLGDVAVLYAWGPATLVTSRRHTSFRYRLTGVLVRDGERWLWRIHHGSEPGPW